jgi:phosphatidylserine/phosphatidylglycerophosphate/cardiolipin synthase-like enzyme
VGAIEVITLTDGGQTADEVGAALVAFLDAARERLELALYDVQLPGPVGDAVRDALVNATARGVAVRLAYNLDHAKMLPPPPRTDPSLIEALPCATRAIPGVPDLMHHKYVLRDGACVWTGSTNWTLDSWTREENVIVVVESADVARRYLEDFEQLWQTREVDKSGRVAPGDGPVRAWFCPGRSERLVHRIARKIGGARRRVRIASPVLTSAPILGTLAEVVSDGRSDVRGIVDATQVVQVIHQWRESGTSAWKEPLLRTTLEAASFAGKRSTPYAPDAVHDYMHAKVTVCDDTLFVGSFNLSHSGEMNAENVLEIADAALAEHAAAYVDELLARYPAVVLPAPDGHVPPGHVPVPGTGTRA